jgi:hypothetical protein
VLELRSPAGDVVMNRCVKIEVRAGHGRTSLGRRQHRGNLCPARVSAVR